MRAWEASPLGVAQTGAPPAAFWGIALAGALAVHAAGFYLSARVPPAPPPAQILDAVAIDLGPPAGRIEDMEPLPPEPEPEPEEDEPEPEPEPDILTERAEDAPPPTPTAPPPPRRPQPSQRLSSGGGAEASTGYGYGGELTLEEYRLIAAYLASARAEVLREVRYPQNAARRSIEGQGALRVSVAQDGRVIDAAIHQSTGSSILDGELERLIRRMRRFPPLPQGFARDSFTFLVPIRFEMLGP